MGRPGLLAIAVVLVMACGGAPVSPAASPGSGHAPGADPAPSVPDVTAGWAAGSVEQPPEGGSATATSGTFCSPCHEAQETSLTAVAARGETLVAVGIQFSPPSAAAWVSTDGLRWRRAAGLAVKPGSVPLALTAAGVGFVAVGTDGPAAAGWASADGETWSATSVTGTSAAATARMRTVSVGPAGLVAGGEVNGGPAGGRAAFWTSPDGRTWTPVRDQPSFAGGSVAGIVATGSLLVAVGTVTSAGTTRAATWSSGDGRTWAPGAGEPSFAGAQLLAVAAAHAGFVAVGTADGGTRAAAWRSADGVHWTPTTDGGAAFTNYGQRIAMNAVAADGDGFVAVGKRDSAGNGSAVAWISRDGTSWRQAPSATSFDGAEMTAVVAAASGVVAVGAIGLPDQWAASAWVAAALSP